MPRLTVLALNLVWALPLCAVTPALAQAAKPDDTTVVTVTAKKPDVVRKIDSTVYNQGDSAATQSGTAADVLNTVPSVNVSPDGDVSLRGNGNVQIYINGKPSAMMKGENRAATLQSMSGSDIASVEVITNPSAKYDANGGAIINLVLKSDRKPGANGMLIVNAGNDGRRNATLSGNRNTGKLNLSGRVSVRDDARHNINRDDRAWRNLDDGTGGRNTVSSDFIGRRKTTRVQGEIEYTLNDTDTLTFEASTSHRFSNNHTREFRQDFDSAGALIQDYVRPKRGPNQQDDVEVEAGFERRAANGDKLTLNASRSATTNRNDRTIDNIYALPARPVMIEHFLGKTVTVGDDLKGDYNHPFGQTQEIAVGFDWRSDNNRFDTLKGDIDPLTGAQTVQAGLTNRFLVTERILAGYVTWQGRFGKWQVQPGVRAESVVTRGHQVTSAMSSRSAFANLTPTVHLAYVLSDEDRWKLSYTRSLERPDARDLNPFLAYTDPQNLRSGNPDLKPQTVSALEGGYEHSRGDTSWSATAYYRQSERTITDYSYFLSDDVLLTTKRNAGNGRSGGLSGEASGKWGDQWKYSLSGNVFYAELQAEDVAGALRHSGVSGTAQISLDYKPNDIDSLHLDGNLSGDSITAQGTRSGISAVNLSWKHKLKPRLSLTVSASDIYNGGLVRTTTRTATVTATNYGLSGGRVFFVGLSYWMGR